jgi:hypothetical protein
MLMGCQTAVACPDVLEGHITNGWNLCLIEYLCTPPINIFNCLLALYITIFIALLKEKKVLYTLNIAETEDMFFEHVIAIGIIAPVKDFTFCWMVNKLSALHFRKSFEHEFCMQKKNRLYSFSIFQSTAYHQLYDHIIYANQNDGEFLLPELRNFDFIWLIQNTDVDKYNGSDIIALIRSIPYVNMCTVLNLKVIEHKGRLIL